ncbi:phage major capsid protein [Euryhalocaulis caribicus]|uniref:phage major capsid protein n=1 Tax=Euryhalocaulis caribicus TaxID=1161401 RepID=UPI00039A1CA5|nr:phage major capsid protein [Euryhalocaulis caribicus]
MKQDAKTIAASPETKAAHHDFLSAFEAFKAANDERLAELEKKAAADTLLEDKVGRIDDALTRQKAALDRMALDAARPDLGEAKSAGPSEAKAAFDAYARQGDAARLMQVKSLSAGSDADGGYVVPEETERTIEARLAEASPIRAIASVRRISAGTYRKPVSLGGAASGWAGETAARPETDSPTMDLLEFPAAELYAMPAATQSLLDDALVDLDDWLAGEVRDVFAAQEGAAFVSGDGVNKPKGFLSYDVAAEGAQDWGELGYLATGVDGDFAASDPLDDLIELIYAPKPGYRANGRFVMNRRTVSRVRRFKDADGNYVWRPAAEAGQASTLLGYAVSEAEDMPDVGSDAMAIAFGDFRRGYLVVDRQGVQVLRDPYSAKPYVLFYTTKRVGGGVQDFDAIKLLKFGVS